MAAKIILARHGRTSWNALALIQGHKGGDLDEEGQKEANQMALQLQRDHPTINLLISSDLLRAMRTAEIVSRILGVPLQPPDQRLRECAFGSLEGLTYQEVLARHGPGMSPQLYQRGIEYDFRPFGGECRAQVIERQKWLLDELRTRADLKCALLVGSGRSFNDLLTMFWPSVPLIERNCDYRVVTL